MIPRPRPRAVDDPGRLLVIDAAHSRFEHTTLRHLPDQLGPSDLLVINDAATLPASLPVVGRALELRLAAWGDQPGEFYAVAFGAGDYRTPTELRPLPERLVVGERVHFEGGLSASVVGVDAEHPRLLRIGFSKQAGELLQALYRAGRPIQYAYVSEPLALWDVQNRFATRPWAFELPSAGQALDGEQLTNLRARGVGIASLTHAAGISSTGDPSLDQRLPFAERYELPAETAQAVLRTRQRGGRIVALGTSVTRALESSVAGRSGLTVLPARGVQTTQLRIGPAHRLLIVDGILSGLHEVGTSHFQLLEAFAPTQLLMKALERAQGEGYRQHEFGDSCLVWARARTQALAA
jgi:S-adenosylmethionine:tRNA ribosyltransferase-isomerase